MKFHKFRMAAVLAFILVLGLAGSYSFAAADAAKFAQPASRTGVVLAPGIAAYQYSYANLYGGPQIISVIAADLNNPAVEIGIGVCADGKRETVSKMAPQFNAVAAVNFGYFNFDPSAAAGMLKQDNKVYASGGVGRGSGGYFAHDGNRVVLYTEDNVAQAQEPNMRAGFPVLVYDGKIYDKIGSYDHVLGRHNRTAIGVTPANVLYMVVVDGRTPGKATGMTCPDLADFMQRIGCFYAINMDGGGSSAMWTKQLGVISYPTDNKKFDHAGERRVYDIFYVKTKEVVAAPLADPVPAEEKSPEAA